jgi:hypothetical protein
MKIRLRFGMAGPEGSFRAGQVLDLARGKAEELIRSNQADRVKSSEAATVTAPEQAARTDAASSEIASAKELTFPKALGGSWFELSNGEKIQGQEEAVAAEAELG